MRLELCCRSLLLQRVVLHLRWSVFVCVRGGVQVGCALPAATTKRVVMGSGRGGRGRDGPLPAIGLHDRPVHPVIFLGAGRRGALRPGEVASMGRSSPRVRRRLPGWIGVTGEGRHGVDPGGLLDRAASRRRRGLLAVSCCQPCTVPGHGLICGHYRSVRDEDYSPG